MHGNAVRTGGLSQNACDGLRGCGQLLRRFGLQVRPQIIAKAGLSSADSSAPKRRNCPLALGPNEKVSNFMLDNGSNLISVNGFPPDPGAINFINSTHSSSR